MSFASASRRGRAALQPLTDEPYDPAMSESDDGPWWLPEELDDHGRTGQGDRHCPRRQCPGRARIAAKTLRRDRWWVPQVVTGGVLALFAIYATIRAFQNGGYY